MGFKQTYIFVRIDNFLSEQVERTNACISRRQGQTFNLMPNESNVSLLAYTEVLASLEELRV